MVALQEEITNHRKVRRCMSRGAERCGDGAQTCVRCGPGRRAKANQPMTCRERIDGSETGVESLPWDEPGRHLPTGQALSGIKVARAGSRRWCGTCEPVAPIGPPSWRWREGGPKQQKLQGAAYRGGAQGRTGA